MTSVIGFELGKAAGWHHLRQLFFSIPKLLRAFSGLLGDRPAFRNSFAIRTPVAFTKESARNCSEVCAQDLYGGGLARIDPFGLSDKRRKGFRTLREKVHKNFRETVAEFVRFTGFLKRNPCPEFLDVL